MAETPIRQYRYVSRVGRGIQRTNRGEFTKSSRHLVEIVFEFVSELVDVALNWGSIQSA